MHSWRLYVCLQIANTTEQKELPDDAKLVAIAGCGVSILFVSFSFIGLCFVRFVGVVLWMVEVLELKCLFVFVRKWSSARFVYGNICLCVVVCNVLFAVSLDPPDSEVMRLVVKQND